MTLGNTEMKIHIRTENMRAATLIDKLDIGVPRGTEYRKNFANLVNLSMQPEWREKVWRDGGHYARRGDFRAISEGEFPVILHQMHRHDRNTGDKIELVETGGMSLLTMASIQDNIYRHDSKDNRVMRLDLCADIQDAPVQWFWDNVEVKGKQNHRVWLNGQKAETFVVGKKPHQLRVYDKTGHRKVLLRQENRRIKGDRELAPLSFEERWGYDPKTSVTRVERQFGGKAEIQRFGFTKFGYLRGVWQVDPFTQLTFPGEIKQGNELEAMKPEERVFAIWLRERVIASGIQPAKNELWRMCERPGRTPNAVKLEYYRLWKKYKSFALPTAQSKVTRIDLLASFRASIHKQLKAA